MRALLTVFFVALLSTPAWAQTDPDAAASPPADGCAASSSTLEYAGAAGALGGGFAQQGLGKKSKIKPPTGTGALLGAFVADKVACLLNPQERAQSERATMQAVEQGVGGQTHWQSETRKGVQGSSSVIAEATEKDGSLCRNVSDVVIVNGEESTINKRLCRAPGATSFVLAS